MLEDILREIRKNVSFWTAFACFLTGLTLGYLLGAST